MGYPDPLALAKTIGAVIKWPIKAMLIVFLLCSGLLWFQDSLPIQKEIHAYHFWLWLGALFSGLWVFVSILEGLWKSLSPLFSRIWKRWRMSWAIRRLEFDETVLLGDYLDSGTVTQHILTRSSALLSLIRKGILVPSPSRTGNWTDRVSYDLTPESNLLLRRSLIYKAVLSKRDAGIIRSRNQAN